MSNKKIETDYFKYDPNATGPEELLNRFRNVQVCYNSFKSQYYKQKDLERELERPDINNICGVELKILRNFVEKTELRYENVYADIDRDTYNLLTKH